MKKTLYLGSEPSHFSAEGRTIIHCPLIKIIPRCFTLPEITAAFDDFSEYTHILFTSKNAVRIFFDLVAQRNKDSEMLKAKELICVGKITAKVLESHGFSATKIAEEETQEGIIKMIRALDLQNAYLFLPRSSLSRTLLVQFLIDREVRHQACEIYDTVLVKPEQIPDLDAMEEIIFTSPSTVQAFFKIFSKIPQGKRLGVLGPITYHVLMTYLTEEHEVFHV